MAFIEMNGSSWVGVPDHRSYADCSSTGPTLECGWRYADGILEVYSDRLGFIPIFYWGTGTRLVVSDSLTELAARMPQLRFDDRAVSAYLRLGYYLGDTTLLEGVRVLPPGCRLIWNGHQATMDSSGPAVVVEPFAGSRADAVVAYDEFFSKAIARRVTSNMGRITLSGGRDSRHILLELHRQGMLPPTALTLRRRNSNDHEVAVQISGSLGVDCIVVENGFDAFALEEIKNRLNFFMADENGWYLPLLDHLRGSVFDGLAGDVLSNGLYFVREVADLVRRGDFFGAARLYVKSNGGYLRCSSSAVRKRFSDDLAYDLIAEEFEKHRLAPNPVQSFVFWNRTRREIALLPIGMARTRVDPLLPYTDSDLLEFLLSLPYEEFGEAGFHDEVIRGIYPAYASIPYARKIKPIYGFAERLNYSLHASRCLLGRFASTARVVAYAAETLKGPNLRALENPFSRLFPLLQAQRELGIDF